MVIHGSQSFDEMGESATYFIFYIKTILLELHALLQLLTYTHENIYFIKATYKYTHINIYYL